MTESPITVCLVEARYYAHISDGLAAGALRVLKEAGVKVERIVVPGALEIPGAIAALAGHADGFVALGCVIRGETYHFEIVANESARGIMDLTVHRGLAVGNGILTVENEKQALARIDAAIKEDKGADAAQACLAMIALKRRLGAAR